MTTHNKNTITSYLATRLPGMVFFIWAYALIWLVYKNHYKAFLQPLLAPFLIIAFVIFAIFAIICFLRKPDTHSCDCECEHHHISFKQALICSLILLLPICFLMIVYDKSLGSYALSKRSAGNEAYITSDNSPTTDTPAEQPSLTTSTTEPTSIYAVLKNWEEYVGKEITIEGAVMKNEQFEANQCLVYRFLIQCCVADARPIGIIIFSENVSQLNNDDWVLVTGIFDIQEFQGNRVAIMKVTRSKTLPQPPIEHKYVSPF